MLLNCESFLVYLQATASLSCACYRGSRNAAEHDDRRRLAQHDEHEHEHEHHEHEHHHEHDHGALALCHSFRAVHAFKL